MFTPNFDYTNKIVRNLTLISEARATILNASLIPKWEVSLRRDALLRSAHSSTAIEGKYRNIQVFVGNRITGEVVFMPPPASQVFQLVSDFLEWFNSEHANETDPVITAGITHYEIVRIHPFVDGNGRTARVMATLVLYKRSFDVKRFFALDDYYDHDRRSYYAALKSVNQDSIDLTKWLEYFTDGVSISIKAVRDKVIGLSKDIKLLKKKGQIALTDRQMKIVERILEKGRITNQEIRGMFDLSDESTRKELNMLAEIGVIKREGRGRSIYYVLP
jgi:Fic family protein